MMLTKLIKILVTGFRENLINSKVLLFGKKRLCSIYYKTIFIK